MSCASPSSAADLTTYVNHDQVLLLVPLQIARTAPSGSLELKANVSWLECDELCIPELGRGFDHLRQPRSGVAPGAAANRPHRAVGLAGTEGERLLAGMR